MTAEHQNYPVYTAFLTVKKIYIYIVNALTDFAETLVHAFFTSGLEFCNLVLYGLPGYLIELLTESSECRC